MTALPVRPSALPPVPAALAMPPALAPSLADRTIRVPISLLYESLHDLAIGLTGYDGHAVVVLTQDYGVAHQGAAVIFATLLAGRRCRQPAAALDAADSTWLTAHHEPGTRGITVLWAARRDLGANSPATRHASLVIDVVVDPAGWPPRLLPDDPAAPPSRLAEAMEWFRNPAVARQRARVRRRVVARALAILGAA